MPGLSLPVDPTPFFHPAPPGLSDLVDDADPVVDHVIPVPLRTHHKATPIGDLPDVKRTPTFSNQDVIDILTDMMSPIANEHLIERAKAIQAFLGKGN